MSSLGSLLVLARVSVADGLIAQFNCLYRWHATTSQADEEWVAKMGEKYFPGKTIDDVSAALAFETLFLNTDSHFLAPSSPFQTSRPSPRRSKRRTPMCRTGLSERETQFLLLPPIVC